MFTPDKIPLNAPVTLFKQPPPSVEQSAETIFLYPPLSELKAPETLFLYPPLRVEYLAVILFWSPPNNAENLAFAPPLIVLSCPPPITDAQESTQLLSPPPM